MGTLAGVQPSLYDLHLSQYLGSQPEQLVLIQPPTVHIIEKLKQKRGRRLQIEYLASFQG